MAKRKRPATLTLADVAAQAGVSRSLASLALRGEAGVLPAKRAHILRVAKGLNYVPNPIARSLASHSSKTLGVLAGEILNPYVALLLQEIDAAARDCGYDALLSINAQTFDATVKTIERLQAQRVAGVILIDTPQSDEEIRSIADMLPVVYVARPLPTLEVDSVSSDDVMGAKLAVEHLISLGHKRIAHIDGGTGAAAATDRRDSYLSTMARAGLEVRVVPGRYSIDAGAEAAATLLEDRANAPTAIFTANDQIALGAMNHLLRSGIRVPQDISLVGYDDMPLAAAETISLTTIRQFADRLAAQSVKSLISRIGDPAQSALKTLISPLLVTRRSSAPPPG